MVEPKLIEANEGDSSAFECRYPGAVKWLFNNKEIHQSNEYLILEYAVNQYILHVLRIISIRASDEGFYECITTEEMDFQLYHDYGSLTIKETGRLNAISDMAGMVVYQW